MRLTAAPDLSAVSLLLVPAEALEPLEGENDQLGVRVNEGGGGPPDTLRQVAGECGPPAALPGPLLLGDEALLLQRGEVQPQGVV